jgi:hypothetical protein
VPSNRLRDPDRTILGLRAPELPWTIRPRRRATNLMNTRSTLFAAILLTVGLSAACNASSHQQVPMPSQDVVVTRPDLTRIYIVREDMARGHKAPILVLDGELEIGKVTQGTYLCWERPGGRTVGRAFYQAMDPSKGNIEGVFVLDCAAGGAYFFNAAVDRDGGKPMVVPLDAKEGRELVAKRRPASED